MISWYQTGLTLSSQNDFLVSLIDVNFVALRRGQGFRNKTPLLSIDHQFRYVSAVEGVTKYVTIILSFLEHHGGTDRSRLEAY